MLVHGDTEHKVEYLRDTVNVLVDALKMSVSSNPSLFIIGTHASVPTVLGESATQLQHLRAQGVNTIDNEISYMAEVAAKRKKRFGCIHILTDYLHTNEELDDIAAGNRPRAEHDLSSENPKEKMLVKGKAIEAIGTYIDLWSPTKYHA